MTIAIHTATIDAEERAWLVNYCRKLTGDEGAADDLAQETLLAAWQGAERRPPDVAPRAWLAGIAHNMVRRWARDRGRALAFAAPLPDDDELWIGDDVVALTLERQELADLLDGALALLPAATRTAFIAHYLEELPQAVIAERLGMSEGALAVRLHRGRLALRRILAPEVADVLPGVASNVGWEATALWCPLCGRHHLEGQFDAHHQNLRLRCADCGEMMNHGVAVGGAKTYGAALNRINRWLASYYLPAAATGSATCFACGRVLVTQVVAQADDRTGLALRIACPCGAGNWCSASLLALLTEAGQGFLRTQRRIRIDALTTVEGAEGPTDVLTFASVTTADRLAIRYQRASLRMLP
jgi:RNA polymerase sigma factor (sigma-70 family)